MPRCHLTVASGQTGSDTRTPGGNVVKSSSLSHTLFLSHTTHIIIYYIICSSLPAQERASTRRYYTLLLLLLYCIVCVYIYIYYRI